MERWTNLTTESAVELAERSELDDPAAAVATAGMRPEEFVARLREEGMQAEAIAVMARALPVREAIGWACLCDRATPVEDDDGRHEALLTAVERWVREPEEEHRQAALELARDEPDQGSGQMLGMAVGYSSGRVAVADNPPVEIPTDMIPPMVAGAVMLAASRVEPVDVEETRAGFLERAVEIAVGRGGRAAGDPGS